MLRVLDFSSPSARERSTALSPRGAAKSPKARAVKADPEGENRPPTADDTEKHMANAHVAKEKGRRGSKRSSQIASALNITALAADETQNEGRQSRRAAKPRAVSEAGNFLPTEAGRGAEPAARVSAVYSTRCR